MGGKRVDAKLIMTVATDLGQWLCTLISRWQRNLYRQRLRFASVAACVSEVSRVYPQPM